MSGQVTETNRVPAVTETKEDDTQTHNNHHDNGGDFDHRKPELDFTVKANGGKVRQRHKPYGDERGYPLGHLREPELHVDPDGGDLRNPDGHPHKPVRPGREIAKERAHITVGVNGERARYRLQKQHFAH